ncbi:hypothetical protein TNCV_2217111 [Trichonephila clavipes]|nr:hypothetical protein TNCV_2217111 [Trichonephila clavipes]
MQQAISSKRGIFKGFRGATLALARTRVTFTSDLNIDLTNTQAAYASLEASTKTCNSEVELTLQLHSTAFSTLLERLRKRTTLNFS